VPLIIPYTLVNTNYRSLAIDFDCYRNIGIPSNWVKPEIDMIDMIDMIDITVNFSFSLWHSDFVNHCWPLRTAARGSPRAPAHI
jgi:hypothetical protein